MEVSNNPWPLSNDKEISMQSSGMIIGVEFIFTFFECGFRINNPRDGIDRIERLPFPGISDIEKY